MNSSQTSKNESRESSFDKFSRNPLVSVVVGFMLTGVVGFVLTGHYQAERARHDATVEGVKSFSDLIYARYTRAALLYSALNRGASDEEIRKRKSDYDDAYFKWGSSLMSNSLLLRQAESAVQYGEFERDFDGKLTPLFEKIDQCLTQAFDTAMSHKSSQPELDTCLEKDASHKGYFRAALDCSYAISDRVYKFAIGGYGKSAWTSDDDVDTRCVVT